MGALADGNGLRLVGRNWKLSGSEVNLTLGEFVLQSRGKLIDICRRHIQYSRFKNWKTITAYRVTANLNQESLHSLRIVFLRGHADEFVQRPPQRQWLAIRTRADHRNEAVGKSHDPHRQWQLFPMQAIRVAGAVGPFVMPPHDLGNLRPRKLHVADDLMSDDRVIRHFAKFFWVQR